MSKPRIHQLNELSANRDSAGLVFLILAHNEELVLQSCLKALFAQLDDTDRVHIVADRCSDRTAQLAAKAGAEVFNRKEPAGAGKGAALQWWVERQALPEDQAVIILDADSVVQSGFVAEVRSAFHNNWVQALQTHLHPVAAKPNPISAVISLSEQLDQRVFDAARYLLGGSVRLRGTGMGVRYGLMKSVAPFIRTNVEDIELTLLLAADNVRIHLLQNAVLDDPKPDDKTLATQQRARWFRGQLQVMKTNGRNILHILGRGPLGWSLINSLFAKPRSFFFPLQCSLLAIGSLWSRASEITWLSLLLAGILVFHSVGTLGALAYSLRFERVPKSALLALRGLPGIFSLWAAGIYMASKPQKEWLRGRPVRIVQQSNESPQRTQ
jgi:cellulose synthase/poly-beta-1,6-N-acetylglucosamine synthase-like glycosyltransferase